MRILDCGLQIADVPRQNAVHEPKLWRPAIGYRLSAIGYRLSAIGYVHVSAGPRQQDPDGDTCSDRSRQRDNRRR